MDNFNKTSIIGAIFLLFIFFIQTAYAQNGREEGTDETARQVAVEEILLGRDDGNGRFGEATTSFLPTDIPIHCSILLTSLEAAEVKMNLVAVKAPGYIPGEKVVVVSYRTNGNQNRVNFTARPPETWPPGTYRVDIYINGKLSADKELEVIDPKHSK